MQNANATTNPVRNLKRVRRKSRDQKKLQPGVDFPLAVDIRALIERQTELRWRAFIIVSAFTGLRNSEVRGLRWEDVDLAKSELHVRQRADRWGVIGDPKSAASRRTVPFGKVVSNTLKELKLSSTHSLVFASESGRPLNREAIVRKIGYQSLHKLRHFYASWLINRPEEGGLGLPPKVVQERLGHEKLAMTMDVYGHLFPVQVDAEQLDAAEFAVISSCNP